MKQFLRETCELWYWALFCPNKLQDRMNEWAPVDKVSRFQPDTQPDDILMAKFNNRFAGQWLLLCSYLSLPLLFILLWQGWSWEWLLLPATIIAAYGLGVINLGFALSIPVVTACLTLGHSTLITIILTAFESITPSVSQVVLGSGIFIGGLILTTLLGWWALARKQAPLGSGILLGGHTLAVGGGMWFASGYWWFATLMAFIILGMIIVILRALNDEEDTGMIVFGTAVMIVVMVAGVVALGGAAVVAGVVAGTVAGVGAVVVGVVGAAAVAGTVGRAVMVVSTLAVSIMSALAVAVVVAFGGAVVIAVVVAQLSLLPLWLVLLVGWLCGWHSATIRNRFLALGIAVGVFGLVVEQHGWLSLAVLLVFVVGYFRLLPNYLAASLMSAWRGLLLRSPRLSRQVRLPIGAWCQQLPPRTDEVVWLPLPAHNEILAAAFHSDPAATMPTFNMMRSTAWPGLRWTARRTLPPIVADQLSAIDSVAELIEVGTGDHEFLPELVPTMYADDMEATTTAWLLDPETSAVLPRFITIAKDVAAAQEAGSPFLRERGLENALTRLTQLNQSLSSLVRPRSLARWHTPIKRWHHILETTIREQRQQHDEVIQPFQTGNPLLLKRADLFKGRRDFADTITRLIVDRGRPTIVLHGPRRCGKSSFLLNLQRLLPSDFIPIYIEVQSKATRSSEGDFWYTVVKAIHRDVRSQGISAPSLPARQEVVQKPYVALEDWLDQLEPVLAERRLLLCFDEFELLGQAVTDGIFSDEVFNELRSLIQHRDHLSFLFCGVQTLDELGPHWSHYFISVQPMEMLYLKPTEARDLLLHPDPKFNLRYEDGVVEKVMQVTRCQPYLLQLIGEAMVTTANANNTQTMTRDLLQAALAHALGQGEPYFTDVWKPKGTPDSELKLRQKVLKHIAQRRSFPAQQHPAVDKMLRHLCRYHIIEQYNDGYRFEVPFVQRWVLERGVIE